MNIKKFINKVTESLGFDKIKKSGKKKALKALLDKLDARREKLSKKLKKTSDKKTGKEVKEELRILKVQIKKAEQLLEKLSNDKKEKKSRK